MPYATKQLLDVLRYIKNNLVKEYIQKIEGQAEANRYYNYPYEVFEEALANAVYHKNYEHQNPIEVNIRLDRVEIISYTGPMPLVNQEMLNSERIITRDYRNSRIGDFLKEMDLTKGRSTGVPKMRLFTQRNGSRDPVFQTDEDRNYFLVTLLYPHPLVDLKKANRQLDEQVTEQVHRMLDVLSTSPLSTQQAMKKLGLKHRPTCISDYLKPALESGWIEMTQPNSPKSPTQKYRLTPKGLSLLKQFDIILQAYKEGFTRLNPINVDSWL